MVSVVAVDDVGRVIHPILCEGQVEGGTLQAVGYATIEEIKLLDGRYLNDRLQTYLIPTSLDAPRIDTILVEAPFHDAPHRAKGVGELPMDVGAPAVVAAIHDATGVWIDDLPATPERILAALAGIDGPGAPGVSAVSAAVTYRLIVNGEPAEVAAPGMRRLLDVLREDLGLTGTKEGCGEGECGACTVLVDGEVVVSCLVPVCQVDGSVVRTVEGLAAAGGRPGGLGDLQDAFLVAGGAQCGICTPGMLMAAEAFLASGAEPTDDGDPRGHRRQPLPLHGLHQDRRLDPARGPPAPRGRRLRRRRCPSSRRSSPRAPWRRPTRSSPAHRIGRSPAARTCWCCSTGEIGPPPERVIDLWRVEELRGIRVQDGALEIGALTTYTQIRRSEDCAAHAPSLVAAAATIGAAQIQNRGTIGGNVMNASPAGDTLPVLLALDASLVVGGPGGERTIPATEFWPAYRKTALARRRAPAPDPDPARRGPAPGLPQGGHAARAGHLQGRARRPRGGATRRGATSGSRSARSPRPRSAPLPPSTPSRARRRRPRPSTARSRPCSASCTRSTTSGPPPPIGWRSPAGSCDACSRTRHDRARREPLRQGRRSASSRSTRRRTTTRSAT